jgi:uncharacterized membrane protein
MQATKYLTVCLGFVAAALMFTPACGGGDDLPDIDCAAVTPPAFADVAALDSCTICHSSTLQGPSRSGAPAGVDYDTYAAAMANAEEGVEEVYADRMPPVGSLNEQDKQDFYAWALCGTPQ